MKRERGFIIVVCSNIPGEIQRTIFDENLIIITKMSERKASIRVELELLPREFP